MKTFQAHRTIVWKLISFGPKLESRKKAIFDSVCSVRCTYLLCTYTCSCPHMTISSWFKQKHKFSCQNDLFEKLNDDSGVSSKHPKLREENPIKLLYPNLILAKRNKIKYTTTTTRKQAGCIFCTFVRRHIVTSIEMCVRSLKLLFV